MPEIEAIEDCRDRLRRLGVDLSAYNSAASAADVADLRSALDIDEWNLFGISYGTRLALTVMRDAPQGVRSVVLDSVYPPNVDAYTTDAQTQVDAILALLRECAADALCGERYPELEQNLYALIDELNAKPLDLRGESINGDDWVNMLSSFMYDSDKIVLLPAAIGEAAAGNYDLLLDLAEEEMDAGFQRTRLGAVRLQEGDDTGDAQGMFYSVECNEEIPFGNLDEARALMADYAPQLADPLLANLEALYETCSIWGAGEAAAVESAAVESNIPTLILNGQLDPITPAAWARLAAETLPNSLYVEVPRSGHSVSSDGDCTMQFIVDFYNDPPAEPDVRCAQEVPPFVLP